MPATTCLSVPVVTGLRLWSVCTWRAALRGLPRIYLCESGTLPIEVRPNPERAFLELRHMLLLLRKRSSFHAERPLMSEETLLPGSREVVGDTSGCAVRKREAVTARC
jgi:hypothetical protein